MKTEQQPTPNPMKHLEHRYVFGTIGDECSICGLLRSTIESVDTPNIMTDLEKILKEFFERFDANKIWVVPSRENVETILDISSFITRTYNHAHAKGKEEGTNEAISLVKGIAGGKE